MQSLLITIITLALWGKTLELKAQMASVVPPASQSGPYSEESSSSAVFQLSVSYGFPKFTLDVGGTRTLSKAADLDAYEDQKPISGTFKGGSSLATRTVASVLFGQKENNFSLGFGLENLELGLRDRMTKSPSQASFELNSLILEGGVQKNMNRWGQTSLRISLTQGLSGKLQTRYLAYPTYQDSPSTYVSIYDSIKTASRLGISGQYLFYLAPAFAAGLYTSADYGTVAFEDRNTKSMIFGYNWGFTVLLRM